MVVVGLAIPVSFLRLIASRAAFGVISIVTVYSYIIGITIDIVLLRTWLPQMQGVSILHTVEPGNSETKTWYIPDPFLSLC